MLEAQLNLFLENLFGRSIADDRSEETEKEIREEAVAITQERGAEVLGRECHSSHSTGISKAMFMYNQQDSINQVSPRKLRIKDSRLIDNSNSNCILC
jgi:hypothetical protein